MRILYYALIFFAAASFAGAVAGIGSFEFSTEGSSVSSLSTSGRVVVFVQSIVLAGAAYGIQRRAIAVWWLGWVVLGASLVSTILSAFSSRPSLPLAVLPFPLLLIGYWAFLWSKQRYYFARDEDAQT
jgi:hypothetical protein